MFLDCGYALAFKGGIEQGKLPARGRLSGHNAVLTTVKMKVFCFITDIMQCSHAGAYVKIHVREIAMLRNVEANSNGCGIAILNFEIDVTHCGIERSWICIGDEIVWRNDPRKRFAAPAPAMCCIRAATGEEE